MEVPGSLQIRRKPITPRPPSSSTSEEKPPPLPMRPNPGERLAADMQMPARPVSRGAEPLLQIPQNHQLRQQKSMPELPRFAGSPPPSPFNATPVTPAATFGPGVGEGKKNFMQTALSEARHFAGGLIPHPTESTKHYTILRHSPPLVFYRGPKTSVAITIFSSPDHPLPADRTLWLQQRGFSGDSGMKIKAFFNATDDWLHVTPTTQVHADHIAPDTERAWQRDISKAARKFLKEKGPKRAHIARETHVVRIPEASEDGYFRLILCTGRGTPNSIGESSSKCKTLCMSPIFRVASTSTDSSVIRGASLSTMPLEMGVFVASMVASTTVDRYVAPVRDPIEAVVDKVRPGFVTETVGGLVRDELSEWSAERDAERDREFFAAHQAHVERSLSANPDEIHPIGPDSGPEAPFPLKFQGKVVPGTGRSQAELGIPTANLSGVADEIRYRLNGIYFGWARISPKDRGKPSQTLTPTPSPTTPYQQQQQPYFNPPHSNPAWTEAIINIAPRPDAPLSVTPKPLVTIHLINPASLPANGSILGFSIDSIIMGLLRPAPAPLSSALSLNQRLDAASRDVCLTLVSLGQRENWTPDAAEARLKTHVAGRGLMDRFDGVKDKVLAKVPVKLPEVKLHRAGIRGGDGLERDRLLGAGGYWVAR
ncbi:hypothetical protein VTI74DRAFT_5961 [Chaetomium olivicolor]